jgi:regulator of replication initiation timing
MKNQVKGHLFKSHFTSNISFLSYFSINTQSTINQHSSSQDLPDVIEPLRKEIEEIFESLTTQELNILIAVYDLEKIKGMAVTYMEVARKLNITPSYLRGYLSNMVLKKAPINKIKTRDKKILLSINKKFKSFDESTNFIKNLNEKSGQRTLI